VADADRLRRGAAAVTATGLLLAGILGLCVGSFLNVCIHRLPRHESLVRPPSRCPKCGRQLSWFDNIPVLSWLALRGRCRRCGAGIAFRYPLVEIVTAALWILIAWTTPPGALLASRLVLATGLIVLFMIDLEHHILPNVITLPGIAVGFLFSLFAPPGPIASLLGIALGAGILYAIAAGYFLLRGEEGMGMGDVKMLAMLGAFLGWRAVLLTLVLSSFAGAIVGVLLMAGSRRNLQYALPFGTFLAMGALVAMLSGNAIIDWYLGFYQ
jgi:leader peptidase (prepilin peptidase) / N-methyltransferase